MADKTNANTGFEKQLWDAACVLWGHIPAAEYRKVIIGLIFLRYISAAFDKRYQELVEEGYGFEDDIDAYTMENVFFVPEEARWNTIAAAAHKGGVFWPTQGSGKSLSMVFYAHLLQDALESPTIVVITDRNDLDDQLFGQFAKCKDFLRQEPVHAESREHLKSLLDGRKANGIIFTTMQKFEESDEPLSERRNIVVMADEAHRGQYGLHHVTV